MWRRYLTFWGRDVDRDLKDEIRFHLEMKVRELIDEGWDPADAQDKARRAFGNISRVRAECRDIGRDLEADMRRTEYFDQLRQDLSFGLRQLKRNPGFALVAVLTLALGIGANSAMFSLVDGVLLRPLQYPNAANVYTLWQSDLADGIERDGVAPANFVDWQAESTVFERMSAIRPYSFEYKEQGRAVDITASLVSEGFFQILGVAASNGRTFDEPDYLPGERAFVISHGLWVRQFGGDPGIVGRQVSFDDVDFTIVGIMPPDFEFPSKEVEIWAPYRLSTEPGRRASGYLQAIAQPKQGMTLPAMQAEMDAIAASLATRYPESNTGISITLVSLHDYLVGHVRRPLLVLLGAVGFVLLIACLNVACLMLIRGSQREQEFAVRTALGAARTRLARQLTVESLVLALLGGTGGLLLAVWVQQLLPLLSPADFPRMENVVLDANVLAFTALVSIGAAFATGLAPLARVFGRDTNSLLKESRRNLSAGGISRRLGSVLVVSEVALALVLLIGAGLLGRSFTKLLTVDPGFVADNALALELHVWDAYPGPPQQRAFFTDILSRIGSLPGVRAAGASSVMPFHGSSSEMERVFQTERDAGAEEAHSTDVTIATVGYFEAMGIGLLQGRVFTSFDGPDAPLVAVVTESAARRYWRDEDPIGERITMDDGVLSTHEVVGIVADTRHTGLEGGTRAEIYLPHLQSSFGSMIVVARTEGDSLQLAEAVQAQIWDVNPGQAISSVTTLGELVDRTLVTRRFYLLLIGLFALTALLLASVGIYGVVSFSTTQRTPELGIRIAFGAGSADILRMVLGQGLGLTLAGVMFGLGLSLALTRFIEGQLFGLTPTDPLTFVGVSTALVAVALLACYMPARRATRLDPLRTLRSE